ncbi:sensor histidine kinase [Oceanobacillus sp. J11TS1]|uniref:sensor histidine kinase n=1 Tax=Oceanobacillus sp. J11TS1 TaxID=2807191 RepID=UPI001B12E745|nr:ATP-binding protein [Oceanobacillus sp. J11TS1]GIO23017.1 histidine kinase [Oceanobacillus sp. J11TS1]
MLKIDKYKIVKLLFYLLHIYLLYRVFYQTNEYNIQWNNMYLPCIFSTVISIFTYMIYTQSSKKSSHFLIYFLLMGSLAYFTAFLQSTNINLAIMVFTVCFQLSGWFFNKFITEILYLRRISYRRKSKTDNLNLILLIFVICSELYSIFFNQLSNIIKIISIIYYLSNMLIPLLKLFYLLLHSKYPENSFLRWMLGIPIIAFGPFLFLFALPLLINKSWVDAAVTTWTFFAIPIGYTYLILSKNLLGLRFILNRLLYYLLLAVIPSFWISLVLIWYSSLFHLVDLIQLFGFLLLIIAVFLMIKEQIDYYFRYAFFQDKNNVVQRVEQLLKDLKGILSLSELNNYVTQEIKKQFNSVETTIIKYNSNTNQIVREYLIGNADFEHIPFQNIARKEGRLLIDYENNIGFFLSRQSNTFHYLWMKKPKNHMRFHIYEKSWLIMFFSYIRLTYENILINEAFVTKIMESNFEFSSSQSRFLFHIAEAERRKIADNIHNTILQNQIYIYRKLDILAEDKYSELLPLKKEFKNIIDRTRTTYREIIPNTLLNDGLSYSLDKLLHQSQQKAPFRLDYEVELTTGKFDYYEKSLIIYRVVEELINNAIKHSVAKRVSVYIRETEKKIYIDYLDDGKGFNKEEALATEKIGLKSIIERIKSLNGIIEFITDSPKNVQIFITIPE